MTLHEPATFATDCALAAIAGALAWRLRPTTAPQNLAAQWWRRTFILTTVSAFVGGAYHGFAPEFSPLVVRVWWTNVLLTICLTGATMDLALLHEFSPTRWRARAATAIALKLAAAGTAAVVYPKFVVAIAAYGLSLAAWAIAAARSRRPWSKWMLAAVGLSVIGALVQQMRWAPSPHFNHNDLYHVLQALGLVAFFRAARRMGGKRADVALAR